MEIILFSLSGMVFLTYLIVTLKEKSIAKREKQESEKVKKHIENLNTLNNNNLSEVFNEALDVYDRQGIRIPIDIIEDLQHDTFHSKDEAIQMIEIQRNNWKLENNKKVVK